MNRALCRLWCQAAVALIALHAGALRGDAAGDSRLPGEPQVQTFSMAEYKSNLQNWAAARGPDGLIYVGGGMGLLEFNGVSWTRHDTPNNSRVRRLLIDDRDNETRFWIGSSNQFGYFRREADGAMVYHSISDRLPEDQRDFGDIRGLVEADGVFYFHALNTLFRFDGERLEQMASWGNVFRLLLEIDGRVLIAVQDRLHDVTEFASATAETPPPPIDRWRWPDRARLTFLEPWPDGRVLLGTYDDGLYWLSEGPPERFEVDFDLSDVWPFVVHRRDDGSFLIGTSHAGLLHFSEDGSLIEHVSSRNGLPKDGISAIAEDDQQGIWLPQRGVISRVALDAPLRTWGPASGLDSSRGMARHDGQILLTGGDGVGRLVATGSDASQRILLESPLFTAFDVMSAEGELLAAGADGVHRLDYRFDADPDSGELLEHERLLEDYFAYRLTRSRLQPVIYAEMETSLALLVRDDGRWADGGRVEGIDVRPHHVAEDADGRVWVGTSQGRFFVMEWLDDGQDDGHDNPTRLSVRKVLDGDDGAPEGYTWPFMLGDRLVLGTREGGFRPVFDAEGEVIGVEPDPDFNNETLGEPRGIYKMASPDGERVLAGIGDGGALRFGWIDEAGVISWQPYPVPGIEFGQNSFIRAEDDAVWIGRAPGLVRLNWPARDANAEPAPLYIMRAGYAEDEAWLRAGPGELPRLAEDALPFQKALLRFEYALAEYVEPEAHRYRVQLEGLDDDWSQWSPDTRRDYTNLPGGDYVFRVQARDGRGLISEADPLAFSIAPPWFLGTPMIAVYVAFALLLLWLAARYGRFRRERILIARQRELEAEVADRTREARHQAREIRRISDARAEFFANVSHELRTPLTLTRAPLQELARDSGGLKPHQREHLDMALRNTEAMQSLIGQVLDLHRLDANRMPLHAVRADLAAALSTVVGRFRLAARSRGIDLELEGVDAPYPATFDPEHLATMVSNLLSNALKFAPRDTSVRVRLERYEDGPGIAVSDQGPGIEPADKKRIFERYQQAESAVPGGTGIGLSLVRELVEMHGGRVSVESRPGHGARFELRLPGGAESPERSAEAQQESGESSAAPAEAAAEGESALLFDEAGDPSGDWPTVLIVDDNAELRGFLRLRLGASYRIVEAGDGREGLARVHEFLPDVVVTDGMMPVMDGLEMTAAIKSDPETDFIPVLMLTARGGSDAVVRGMQAGADDYLAKPFDNAELAARLAGLISSRRRLRERLAAAPEVAPVRAVMEDEIARSEDPFVVRARALLADHLGEPGFSVRDWAVLLHMDRTTLFRKFKAAAGRSPDEELRELRLQRAAELLSARAGNVAEVADAVGFASVSAFSRRFRERFDESPAAYARKGCEG